MSIKVSVLVTAYNQEKYIQDCINSILNQTYQNFEIIINNDCSTDRTSEKINEIKDSRIKMHNSEYNQGINAALNNAYALSDGDLIVFMGGDDMSKPNHLETVVNFFENNPDVDVTYCNLAKIDENNNNYRFRKKYIINVLDKDLLHYGLLKGNFGISPGMAVKRSFFEKIVPLPYSLVNYQDVKMHFELLAAGAKFAQIEDKLVDYRICSNNISKPNLITKLRSKLETDFLMDTFFKITDINILEKSFEKEIIQTGIKPYPETLSYFYGRMAMLSQNCDVIAWGYRKIVEFMSTKENFNLVNQRYGLEFKDFLKLVAASENSFFAKGLKYKKAFNITLVISILLSLVAVTFAALFFIQN